MLTAEAEEKQRRNRYRDNTQQALCRTLEEIDRATRAKTADIGTNTQSLEQSAQCVWNQHKRTRLKCAQHTLYISASP